MQFFRKKGNTPHVPYMILESDRIMADLASVPDDIFLEFYHPLLADLERLAGVDNRKLIWIKAAVIKALRLRAGVILPPGHDPHVVAERKDAWTYGVFLCALFFGLDQCFNSTAIRCPWSGRYPETEGKYHPLTGRMVALSFVPKSGLSWLWRDTELWSEWIAAIHGEYYGSGEILRIVSSVYDGSSQRENAEIIRQKKEWAQQTSRKRTGHEKSPDPAHREKDNIRQNPFLIWIKKQMDADPKESLIHFVGDGLLLESPDIFKRFAEEHEEEWTNIQKRILRRKWHLKSADGTNFHQMEVNGRKVRGILLGSSNVMEFLSD